MRILAFAFLLVPLLSSCAVSGDYSEDDDGKFDSPASSSGLGAAFSTDGKTARFRVASKAATRIEVYLYAKARGEDELGRHELKRDSKGIWSVEISTTGLPGVIYYGYRAWGPNWP